MYQKLIQKMSITGEVFNGEYPGQCLKFLRRDMTHNGYTWKEGLNVDPNFSANEKGFYFFNDFHQIKKYYYFGPRLALIKVPDDAQVYIEDRCFRADRLEVVKVTKSEEELLQFYKRNLPKENPRSIGHEMSSHAAAHGHLEILKWLMKEKYRFGGGTTAATAKSGRVDILEWLLKCGCPVNSGTIRYAIKKNNKDILMCLKNHNPVLFQRVYYEEDDSSDCWSD